MTEEVFGTEPFLSRAIKVADLDADGDADIVVSGTYGTPTRLFLGGDGAFAEAPHRVPAIPLSVGDLELGDVDGDLDLDILLADWGEGSPMANAGGRTRLWRNVGDARFEDVTDAAMPDVLVGFSWEAELLDVDGDWDLDAAVSCKQCTGSYLFDGKDRLLVNDGAGGFTMRTGIIDTAQSSGGTLGIAVADLDLDGRLDLVEGQGEVAGHESERVYIGTLVEQDSAPPSVAIAEPVVADAGTLIRARVHDRISPLRSTQFQSVVAHAPAEAEPRPMTWYGEYLWAATIEPGVEGSYRVCATDAAGLETCSD
jgi:hypothetical protein